MAAISEYPQQLTSPDLMFSGAKKTFDQGIVYQQPIGDLGSKLLAFEFRPAEETATPLVAGVFLDVNPEGDSLWVNPSLKESTPTLARINFLKGDFVQVANVDSDGQVQSSFLFSELTGVRNPYFLGKGSLKRMGLDEVRSLVGDITRAATELKKDTACNLGSLVKVVNSYKKLPTSP